MRTKQALASALICVLALGFNASANVVYDQEVTNAWFSVTAANANLSDANHWSKLKDGNTAKVEGSVIKLDTDFDDPLTYTPDKRSGGISIVSAKLEATANASEPTFTDTPQAALMVRITDDGVATNWYGLVGGSEGSTWMKFENLIPTVGVTYDIKIEFDLRESANNIRYSVGGTILGTGWYDNPKTDVTSIGAVSFAGTGDVGDFDGKNVSEAAASFNGVNYTTFDAALTEARNAWPGDHTPVVLYKDAEYEASATEKLYIDANSCDFTIKGDVAVDWNGTECSITAGGACEAKIGEVFYSTIEKAIAAAEANQTITVNKALDKVLAFNNTSVTLDTNGKSVTCATLKVAQDVTLTLANALAVTDANVAGSVVGSVAGAALTVNGTLTGTNVWTLTFGDSAIFAHNGAPLAATTLTVGARLTSSGLESVQRGDVIINDIGEADVSKFVAQTAMPEGLTLGKDGTALKVVKAAPDVEIELKEDTAGYDFTNGTVSVTATVQSRKSGSLVLKYIDFDSGTETVLGKQVSGSGTVAWDLSDLMPGGTYSYVIEVFSDSADKVIDTKYGTFTAANWADDVWFGADASSGEDVTENGSWAGGVAPKIDNGAYVIDENSVFDVTDASAGSNRVARVDVSVLFDSMTDVETLTVESGALGGFLAAAKGDGGVWMALTVANGEPTWVELTGAVAPEVNKPYVVRAEVSFLAEKKQVRYLVSDDDGENFFVLADENSKQWLALADNTKGTLARLELRGEGKVVKFTAKVSDRALAEVDGVKYVELADALAAARDKSDKQVKLLTNVTLTPAAAGTYRIDKNGHAFELKLPTGWTGEWDEETGTLTVEEPVSGATYLIW